MLYKVQGEDDTNRNIVSEKRISVEQPGHLVTEQRSIAESFRSIDERNIVYWSSNVICQCQARIQHLRGGGGVSELDKMELYGQIIEYKYTSTSIYERTYMYTDLVKQITI